MVLYSNRLIVLRLIQKATEDYPDWTLGKKALQKSLYFFNLTSGRFSFRWANFGPISGEIQQIVHDLNAVGRIKISPVQTGKPNAFLHSVKYVEKTPRLETKPDLDESLDAIMKFVAGRNSRELELLASVHFWAERSDTEDTTEYIHGMLEELKPEAEFTKTDVKRALDELKANHFLK